MKQVKTPTLKDLTKSYEELAFKRKTASTKSFTTNRIIDLASWVRHDARLGEILVTWLCQHFDEIDVLDLSARNRLSPNPAVLLVLLEFARQRLKAENPLRLSLFNSFMAAIAEGIRPAPPQMFFVQSEKPNPNRDLQTQKNTLRPFKQWGFFADESLLPLKLSGKNEARSTLLTKEDRKLRLQQMISTHRSITVQEYLKNCQFLIHRRTAERDLASHPRLRAKGFTRNRCFVVQRPAKS